MRQSVRTLLVWVGLILIFLGLYQLVGVTNVGHQGTSAASVETEWVDWLFKLLPVMVILGVFLFFYLRTVNKGGQGLLGLRGTTARLISNVPKVTFADVGGLGEAKLRMADVVDFLRHPKRWEQAGARLPRGVLLEGPPGSGKTLLARALAGEAKVPFFEVAASEFMELFVGVGAARVRDLFEQAKKKAPAILFIDEIDAVGRRRGASSSGLTHQEREQTLNQLLVCLDGFTQNTRLVVVAATNRADVLDPALIRPGRFDVRLEIPALTTEDRLQILQLHTRAKKLGPDVDLRAIAERAVGAWGSELEHLANEAALKAVRRSGPQGTDTVEILAEDFASTMTQSGARDRRFDKLDSALVESLTQLTQPTGKARVRAHLDSGPVQGELVWLDAAFIKLRRDDGSTVLVSKSQIRTLEALAGTETELHAPTQGDPWARLTIDAS